jgi:hypothetical protein
VAARHGLQSTEHGTINMAQSRKQSTKHGTINKTINQHGTINNMQSTWHNQQHAINMAQSPKHGGNGK